MALRLVERRAPRPAPPRRLRRYTTRLAPRHRVRRDHKPPSGGGPDADYFRFAFRLAVRFTCRLAVRFLVTLFDQRVVLKATVHFINQPADLSAAKHLRKLRQEIESRQMTHKNKGQQNKKSLKHQGVVLLSYKNAFRDLRAKKSPTNSSESSNHRTNRFIAPAATPQVVMHLVESRQPALTLIK